MERYVRGLAKKISMTLVVSDMRGQQLGFHWNNANSKLIFCVSIHLHQSSKFQLRLWKQKVTVRAAQWIAQSDPLALFKVGYFWSQITLLKLSLFVDTYT